MNKKIWIDILNPSHPLFFKPVIKRLSGYNDIQITIRDRGETVPIANDLGIQGKVIGKDRENPFLKTSSIALRTLQLSMSVKKFDIALSFENPMSVAVSWLRRKNCILMLDNDVKYSAGSSFIQRVESKLKTKANTLIVPGCTEDSFKKHFKRSELLSYNGYKEDIYIADHIPDRSFLKRIPLKDYLVIRPEAFASFYVKHEKTLLHTLFDRFEKEGIGIIYLPRDKSDWKIGKRANVHIPPTPLNGIDLIYYSSGVLTGSGTMAREGAILGKKSVSFFPGEQLLSVDRDLIEKGMMIHSRDVNVIVDYMMNKTPITNVKHDPLSVQREFIQKLRFSIEDKSEL